MLTSTYIIGQWTIEPELNRLSRVNERGESQQVTLVPKVMALLQCLTEHAGQPVHQNVLMEKVWPNRVVSDSSVYQAVAQLRKALGDTQAKKEYIDRVSGKGYRLIAQCTQISHENTPNADVTAVQKEALKPTPLNNRTVRRAIAGITTLVLAPTIALFFNPSKITVSNSPLTTKQSGPTLDISKLKSISVVTLNTQATTEKQLAALNDVIVTQLSHIGHMKIVTLPSINDAPATEAILKGNINQQGNNIRVFLQLENTKDKEVIWAKRFKGDTANLFSLQDQIVNSLLLLFKRSPSSALSTEGNIEKHSFDQYLLARHLWEQRNPEALGKARSIYENMAKNGQLFPLAAVGLCDTYHFLYLYSNWTIDKVLGKCNPLLTTALAKQPNLGQALASQGFLLSRSSQPKQAEALFKQAIRLTPNYPFAHMWYGNFIRDQGRVNEALRLTAMAYELSPMSPIVNRSLAYSYLNLHNMPEAAYYYQRSLTIEPNYTNRAVEELEFLPMTVERIQNFSTWLGTHNGALIKQPSFQLKQAQIALALGDTKKADAILQAIDPNKTNTAFLWYVQASYFESIGDLTAAHQLFKKRSRIDPNSLKLALPYIYSLYELENYKEAYTQLLKSVPELALENMSVSQRNQHLLALCVQLSHRLGQHDAKLAQQLEQWFSRPRQDENTQGGIAKVEWLLFTGKQQQGQKMLKKMMSKGWLPDTNIDPFIYRKMKRLFIDSGLNEVEFTKMLSNNQHQAQRSQ